VPFVAEGVDLQAMKESNGEGVERGFCEDWMGDGWNIAGQQAAKCVYKHGSFLFGFLIWQ